MSNQNETIVLKDRLNVILIGFKYDKATILTFPWITEKEFLASYPNEKIHRFHKGSKQEQQKLRNLLNQENESDSITVEIFLGHGKDDVLLGPPKRFYQEHSPFYEMDMISTLPGSLFAYSCFSAKKFGLKYSSAENKVFMGFMDKIFLPYEILSELKIIFQKVAEEIVNDGEIREAHEKKFKLLIKGLIEDVRTGEIECKFPNKVIESYLMPYLDSMKII